MTLPWIITGALVAVATSFIVGRATGYGAGQAAERAKQNQAVIKSLEDIIESSAHLVLQANAASNEMRAATARRAATDRQSTEELRRVLFDTQGDRMLCRFDADSMRIIRAAREAAANAAAGGIRGAVSGSPPVKR